MGAYLPTFMRPASLPSSWPAAPPRPAPQVFEAGDGDPGRSIGVARDHGAPLHALTPGTLPRSGAHAIHVAWLLW